MTAIKIDNSPKPQSKIADFNASAVLDFNRRGNQVKLKLEGAIPNDQADALRDFLKTVVDVPGNRWTLQLEEVAEVCHRGLHELVAFARAIRRRGQQVEIITIQPHLRSALLELDTGSHFSWKK